MLSDKPSFITTCSEDEEGNLILDIPDELLETMGWGEGTVLDISALPNSIMLRKVEPADAPENGCLVEGECSAE
jgi:bifunctional DNA-binding transcriptional regulator/antitoxin component of YhaV-PrlF toxin-antitoxin module